MRAIEPSDSRALRRFGLGLAVLIAVLFGWLVPWLRERVLPGWPFYVAAVLAAAALLAPRLIHPVHRLWLPVARTLGWINTWLVLGLAFFLCVVPLGWYARVARRLHYRTGFDRDAPTYRTARPRRSPVTDLTKPW